MNVSGAQTAPEGEEVLFQRHRRVTAGGTRELWSRHSATSHLTMDQGQELDLTVPPPRPAGTHDNSHDNGNYCYFCYRRQVLNAGSKPSEQSGTDPSAGGSDAEQQVQVNCNALITDSPSKEGDGACGEAASTLRCSSASHPSTSEFTAK